MSMTQFFSVVNFWLGIQTPEIKQTASSLPMRITASISYRGGCITSRKGSFAESADPTTASRPGKHASINPKGGATGHQEKTNGEDVGPLAVLSPPVPIS